LPVVLGKWLGGELFSFRYEGNTTGSFQADGNRSHEHLLEFAIDDVGMGNYAFTDKIIVQKTYGGAITWGYKNTFSAGGIESRPASISISVFISF